MNIGQQISHYMLEEKIGEGGFGDVFRARDVNTGMDVAIKCSRPDSAEGKLKDREQRFLREVSCISKLRHPNIVQLFDYGSLPDGTLYLVMEYVCGLNLEQLIKRDAPFSYTYASDIILQVLDALSEAHTQGIVHRDLKPANIILVRQGLRTDVVKLCDFGIAKAFNGTEPDLTRQNFQKGAGFGTPQYMPPEQFYGKKIGPHSDLYAVGLVFYELLTGKQACGGKTLSEVIEKQLKKFPEIPEPFNEGPLLDMFKRALAKQISARYTSATDMYYDIDAIVRQPSPYLQRYSSVANATSKDKASHIKSCASVPAIPATPDDDFDLDAVSTVDTKAFEEANHIDISGYSTLIFDGEEIPGIRAGQNGASPLANMPTQMQPAFDAFDAEEMIPTDDMSRVSPAVAMAPKLVGLPSSATKTSTIKKPWFSFGKSKQQDTTPSAPYFKSSAPDVSSEMDIATSCMPTVGRNGFNDSPDTDISDLNTLMVGADMLPPEDEMPPGFHEQSTKFLPKMNDPATEDLPPVFHEQRTQMLQKGRVSSLRRPTHLGDDLPDTAFTRFMSMYSFGQSYLNSDFYRNWRHFKHRLSKFIDNMYEKHFTELVIGVCLVILLITIIILLLLS